MSSATRATEPRRLARREVREVIRETPSATTLVLDVPGWPGHRAGPARRPPPDRRGRLPGPAQLLDRVPARGRRRRAHGRAARRRRGVAVPGRRGAAGRPARAARPGRRLVRVEAADGGPLFLVAGGSGLVPLMAMLRHRAAGQRRRGAPAAVGPARAGRALRRRAARARRAGDHVHARGARRLDGLPRRVDREMLAEAGFPPERRPRVYVCGPTGFVEGVARRARRARPRHVPHPDRALRRHGRLTMDDPRSTATPSPGC